MANYGTCGTCGKVFTSAAERRIHKITTGHR